MALILYCLCPCTVAVIRCKVHRRVGEAKNPGPTFCHGLDDSQADPWEEERAADDVWDSHPAPPLVDDSDAEVVAPPDDDLSDGDSTDSDTDDPDWIKASWKDAEKLVGLVTRDEPPAPRCPHVQDVHIPPGAPSFPAKVFGGPADGYIFTTRGGVSGYYLDVPKPKQVLVLDQLVVHATPDVPTLTDKVPASHAYRRDGKRCRGRGRHAKATLKPSDCVALNKGVTTLDDGQFRQCGLWAVDTINPNSWTAARDRILTRVAADFALLQETREFTEAAVDKLKREARSIGWSAVASPAWRTAADKGSGGCAVLAAKGTGIAPPTGLAVSDALKHRIVVGWASAMIKGGVHLVSVYPKDGVGLNEDNMHLLQELAALLKQNKGPWIVAADWNLAPTTLAESKWPEMVRGVIVATERATCFSSTYDYFVVPEGLSSAVAGIARVEDAALYPHYPVRLFIESSARRILTRQLTKPARVPGTLPHGPLPQPVCHQALYPVQVDESSIDTAAQRWVEAARGEWASLASTTPDFSAPKFRWGPAVGPKAEAYAGASAQSQWWRLAARRADECATLLMRQSPAAGEVYRTFQKKAVVGASYAGFGPSEVPGVNGWLHAVATSFVAADALSVRGSRLLLRRTPLALRLARPLSASRIGVPPL